MREIVLDTETTGFDPESGDRIVEIGAVELWNHVATGETYHVYINPERGMPDEAFGVHGIGPDLLENPRPPEKGEVTLKDKPVFAKVGHGFREFVGDARSDFVIVTDTLDHARQQVQDVVRQIRAGMTDA